MNRFGPSFLLLTITLAATDVSVRNCDEEDCSQNNDDPDIMDIFPGDSTADVFLRYSNTHWKAKEYDKAIQLHHMALNNTKDKNKIYYVRMAELGYRYESHPYKRNFVKAEDLYRTSLAGFKKVLGSDHLTYLIACNNLGIVLRKQKKFKIATRYFKKSERGLDLKIQDKIQNNIKYKASKLHKEYLNTVNSFGRLYEEAGKEKRQQHKLNQASSYFKRAIEGYLEIYDNDHPNVLDSLGSLGNVATSLLINQNYIKALSVLTDLLNMREQILGMDHYHTLTTVNNLASVLQGLGRSSEAEPYFRRELETNERTLGSNHIDTLTAANNLCGFLLIGKTNYKGAEALCRHAYAGLKRTVGKYHSSTLSALSNLACSLDEQNKVVEAEKLFRRALKGMIRSTPKHSKFFETLAELADLLEKKGKWNLDEKWYRIFLEMKRK